MSKPGALEAMRADPQHWARPPQFDPRQGRVICEPPAAGEGYWAGAPGAFYDEMSGEFYLTYRIRRPRGVEPDRGAEVRLARSPDGVQFETIWTGHKEQLGSSSIERCALRRLAPRRWALYISYVDPQDGRWRIDVVTAAAPTDFDLADARPALLAPPLGVEGVKDPFVFQVAGGYHMLASFAERVGDATERQLHCTHDAYNTGLIRSATALALSGDGLQWSWQGEVLGPAGQGWDRYCVRIGTLWRQDGLWVALYDGSADVSENYEERVGVAYSHDLSSFRRVTTGGPLMEAEPRRALRYFDVLSLPEARYFYYEMARPDGSHDLRVFKEE